MIEQQLQFPSIGINVVTNLLADSGYCVNDFDLFTIHRASDLVSLSHMLDFKFVLMLKELPTSAMQIIQGGSEDRDCRI